MHLLYGNRFVIVIILALLLSIYNTAPNSPIQSITPRFIEAEANLFPWFSEFVYEIDAPDYVKELADKTSEKHYRLYKAYYEVAGTKIGALLVKLHVTSKQINEHEIKIDFNVKAKHAYAKNDHFDIKKKSAEVSGYSILNLETEKLSIHVPWAEILKNMQT